MKKILFVGNSHLIPIYEMWQVNSNFLEGFLCSFFIDTNGKGPGTKIINDRLIPSERLNKDIYPDVFYPGDLMDIPVSSYDAIIIVAIGYIGDSRYSELDITSMYQIFEYSPKKTVYNLAPIGKEAYRELFYGYLESQSGMRFLSELKEIPAKKILIEFPLYNEGVKNYGKWILNEIYFNPVEACIYFINLRKEFLQKKCIDNDFHLISSPFEEVYFTPFEYKHYKEDDYMHATQDYWRLMCGKILQII